jgi:hypothetical protein
MPASRAVTGNKAVLYIGSVASPMSYNALLEIKSMQVTFVEVPQVDVTHLLSPNSTEEFYPGLIKPSAIDCTGNYVGDATQASILALAEGQYIIAWKITAPVDQVGGNTTKTATWTGIGFVKTYGVGPFEQNKALDYKVGIQISGTMTESVA